MPHPRLFVDSADREAVGELLRAGWVHGVTTNPTVLDRAGHDATAIPALYEEWAEAGAREIFVQTWGADAADLERRARDVLALGELAVVKIVATPTGLALGTRLAREGAPVLLTGVATPAQALAAASAGIRYIAPYLGRLRDAGIGDVGTLARMQRVAGAVDQGGTEVLAASLRSAQDLVALAEQGITAMTAAPAVLHELIASPATEQAEASFAAARSVGRGLELALAPR